MALFAGRDLEKSVRAHTVFSSGTFPAGFYISQTAPICLRASLDLNRIIIAITRFFY